MEKKLEGRFEQLVKTIHEYNENVDLVRIRRAFEFAKLAHAGEKRISGSEVIWHPLETSIILASWKMDIATIVAGLLHDTIEHGAATEKDISEYFGEEVLGLVKGVTKVSKIKLKGSSDEIFVENLRKMFLAIAKDLRIVFLRLAERIDNLKSYEYVPEEQRKLYAKDSLEIYAPLAERLGMWEVKTQIDDLSFPYVYPQEYQKVKKLSALYYKDAEKRVEKMKKNLLRQLKREGVDAKIHGRKKGLFSLWKKLDRPEIDWDLAKIHDIVALRMLVEEVSECYVALGIVHKYFKPIPHLALADFIAVPKPNGYSSIHTKVFGENDKAVEIQITTHNLHEENQYGLAAHWHLSLIKSRKGISSKDIDVGKHNVVGKKFEWVEKLAEWQKEISDSEEFLKAVKFDALSRRIFVFSPKGDVFDLPMNATPVDFTFAVHSDLGDYIKAAKVDGKIVPLNYKLKSGQVVEILKSKEKRLPSHDWLEFVVTNFARREITKTIRKNDVDRN